MASQIQGVPLQIHGNVRIILEGKVSRENSQKMTRNTFSFALGGGWTSSIDHFGETVFLAGNPWLCPCNSQGKSVETGDFVLSPFLVGVQDTVPPFVIQHQPPTAQPLPELYRELLQEYPEGCLAALLGDFTPLECTFVQLPPIYGENINDLYNKYWAPLESYDHSQACLVAVVLPSSAPTDFNPSLIQKFFYHNVRDPKSTDILSHTHGALLPELPASALNAGSPASFMKTVQNLKPGGVRHISSQTRFRSGVMAVYPFSSLAKLES